MDIRYLRLGAVALLGALASLDPVPVAATSPLVRQAGGELGDVAAVANVVYLGQGPSISVWALDPTGAAAPSLAHTTAPLPGLVQGLATTGTFLFASYRTQFPDGAVAIYSIANPAAPSLVRVFRYSASTLMSPGDLLVVGSTLLVADAEVGLHALDITNPLVPVVTTTLPGSVGLRRLALLDGDLVGWGRSFFGSLFLETFDLSNPSSPSSLAIYGSGNFFDVALVGSQAVLTGDGLEVVDLSDLDNPTQRVLVPEAPGSFAALAVGTHVYIGTPDGLHVWDLSDPDDPAELTVIPAPAARTALMVRDPGSGDLLALTETGRALVFDLGSPAAPSLVHELDLPVGADPTAVVPHGPNLLIADFYSGLRVTTADLGPIGRLDPDIPLGAYEDVAVDGNVGYLAAWGFGILTVDLASPASPTVLGSVPFEFASAVAVEGGQACAVRSTNGGALAVLDVQNPSTPSIAGEVPISKGWDVVLRQNLALVADESSFDIGGLRIHDVSNPSSPVQIGHYAACDSAGGVDWSGNLGAVACHDGSVHVVDITNPAQPLQLGVWSDPSRFSYGTAVRFSASRLWFGHSAGVDLLDLRNPTQPRRLGSAELAAPVRDLELDASGRDVWVATGLGGVYQVALVVFEDGFESGTTTAWSTAVP